MLKATKMIFKRVGSSKVSVGQVCLISALVGFMGALMGAVAFAQWLRMEQRIAEDVPDFDPKFRKVYDESDFHDTRDPNTDISVNR